MSTDYPISNRVPPSTLTWPSALQPFSHILQLITNKTTKTHSPTYKFHLNHVTASLLISSYKSSITNRHIIPWGCTENGKIINIRHRLYLVPFSSGRCCTRRKKCEIPVPLKDEKRQATFSVSQKCEMSFNHQSPSPHMSFSSPLEQCKTFTCCARVYIVRVHQLLPLLLVPVNRHESPMCHHRKRQYLTWAAFNSANTVPSSSSTIWSLFSKVKDTPEPKCDRT